MSIFFNVKGQLITQSKQKKEIIKTRVEINEIENRKNSRGKSRKSNAVSVLGRINKTGKPQASLTKNKKEKIQVVNIRKKRKNSVTVFTDTKKIWDFTGGTVVKNLPASAGDTGSIPAPGRSHVPQSN